MLCDREIKLNVLVSILKELMILMERHKRMEYDDVNGYLKGIFQVERKGQKNTKCKIKETSCVGEL